MTYPTIKKRLLRVEEIQFISPKYNENKMVQ